MVDTFHRHRNSMSGVSESLDNMTFGIRVPPKGDYFFGERLRKKGLRTVSDLRARGSGVLEISTSLGRECRYLF